MNLKVAFDLLKETYNDWSEDNASNLAAALAYYTIFSLGPLLLMAIVIAGLLFGEEAARGEVFAQLDGLLGPEAAKTVQDAVQNTQQSGATTLSAIIGIATLLWSSSGLFAQLQSAMNTIWEVAPYRMPGIFATIKKRFLSMTMVLGIGFLLLVSLVLTAVLSVIGELFGGVVPGMELIGQGLNFVISFAVITLLFAAIYKVLPDVTISWRDVWIGAAVTALLFTIGKLAIGLYLGHASVGSTYGAAGSLLVLLVWVYYSAMILFFGAEFTQVYAKRYGSRIVPSADAVPLTEAARAHMGIPRKEAVEQAARTGQSVAAASRRQGRYATSGQKGATAQPVASTSMSPQQSAAFKQMLWAGFAAGMLGLAGILARRTTVAIWETLVHEPPPPSSRRA